MAPPTRLHPTWVSLCCGAVFGACQGFADAWPLAAVAMAIALAPWTRPGTRASRAALGFGSFWSAAAACAGIGTWLGLPPDGRALAVAPWALWVLAHGTLGAAAAWVAQACTPQPFWRLSLALPAGWLMAEALLSIGPWAAPWLRLSHVAGPGSPWAAWFPWGGGLLVGAVLLATAGWAALAACAVHERSRALATLAAFGLLSAGLADSTWTRAGDGLPMILAQPGSALRADADDAALQHAMAFYLKAAERAAGGLVVSPELALPRLAEALPAAYRSAFEQALRRRGSDAWLGLYVPDREAGTNPPAPGDGRPRSDERPTSDVHNALLSFGVSGRQQHLKRHLVPIAERPAVTRADEPAPHWGSTGPRPVGAAPDAGLPLLAAGLRAAPALCFEVAFADTLRQRAQGAQLLVVMSSDSSSTSDQALRQSIQMSRLRALELQKPVVRVSDRAGSLWIDHHGTVRAQALAGRAEALAVTVATRIGSTPYERFGDAPAVGLAGGVLAAAAARSRARHARRGHRPATLPSGRTARQRGQVLPAAVALLLVMAGVFYLMVNSSQTVIEKTRATQAADAAAYSAGVVEARALNFHAYTNRAIVANQIAIAQMVSLASWVDYFATAADNWGSHAEMAHLFTLPDPKVLTLDAAFFGMNVVSYYTGTTAQEYANYINEYGIAAVVTVHNAVSEALSASQQLVSLNLTAGLRQRQIAQDVVRAMDPALSAEVVPVSHGFDRFTHRYARNGERGDERGRLADVVMRSRDAFTRERNWTARGIDIPFVRDDGALRKRAGTELIGYDEWRAMDTLELHGRVWGCGKFGLSWCPDIAEPIGWGAVAVGSSDSGSRGTHGGAYADNRSTANRAEENMRRPSYAWYTGIPDSQELSDLADDAAGTTGVSIRVTKPHAALLTSGGAAQARPSGALAQFGDRPAGAELAALSRAEVYFDRVGARADGQDERASLYNPYWRVRLVAPTVADKAWAAARQQGLALP